MNAQQKNKKFETGSFLLGFGFLGAMDGIVFHQLLQWHSVIMDTTETMQIVSDGLFHLAVTITLIAGAVILWMGGRPPNLKEGFRRMLSMFLIGGGIFNLVEGIINHHILQIHRVHPEAANPLFYDLAFLASGAVLVIIGVLFRRGLGK
ncbi:DUF2243 domain-containing protein [Alkalicoccus saliphilus]|nr:DUF2243 domain-containing protein [Alkalicoccus saliphilus]